MRRERRRFVRYCFLLVLLNWIYAFTTPAWAGSGYQLTAGSFADGEFSPPAWYYRDATNKIDITKAKSLYTQNAYRRLTPDFNAGLGQPTHWFKILIDVDKNFDAYNNPIVYLDIKDPLIDTIEIFHEVNGELRDHFITGDAYPHNTRPFATASFVLPVRIEAGDIHEFWLRVENKATMHLPVKVWSPEKFHDYESERFLYFGILVGIGVIMLFYKTVIGVRVKSADYFFYVGLLITGILHRIFLNGLAFQHLWPNTPEINQYIRPILDCGLAIFSLFFTQYFLSTKKLMPLLHQCINFWIVIAILFAVTVFIIPYHYSLHLIVWVLMIALLAQYAIGIECWLNNIKLAKLYLIAWFVFVFSGLTNVFAVFGAIPHTPLTVHSVEYGVAFQVLILSLALSERIAHIQDEKLEAEQKNVEHMAQYQDLYEKSFDGIFEIDSEGVIQRMNPAFRSMFAIQEQASISLNSFWEYWRDKSKLSELQHALDANYQVINFESEMKTNEERAIWTSVTLQPSVKNGQLHYDGVIRDISESKEKEKALRDKQDAEAATTAKSAFLANMSHEIRTPLTAIIGFAEDARSEDLDRKDLNESIDTIIRSSHHLLDIINEILDLSKIEAGKLELENLKVNLVDLINDIHSVFDKRIKAKGLEFKLDYQLPIPKQITCDPTRLKQIILNLLSNALKFTEQGCITLKIAYQKDRDEIHLEVIDTGIGMTAAQQEKIFDAFTQADVTTTRNFGGTGLGLNIVKQLLSLMKGDVSVNSEEGIGSTFSVNLPANCTTDAPLITDANQIKTATTTRSKLDIPQLDAYILYADDNMVNQQLVKKLISKTGAELELVDNGAEAMLSVFKRKPDLILMDIKMPVISGKTAGLLLREYGYKAPIIAFTANVMANEIDEYLKAGFNSYLEKPVNIHKFYFQLSALLGQQSTHQATEEQAQLKGDILLAEDNHVNQLLIRKFLQKQGAKVTVVENGQLAIEALENNTFDLILMDLEMPVLNGYQAFETMDKSNHPPIYALTADNDTATKKRCEEMGFNGVLTKPIEKDNIRTVLEQHLKAQ